MDSDLVERPPFQASVPSMSASMEPLAGLALGRFCCLDDR